MSLPDTVFIFVLALIIFGPKKLPEIGRQIGKLVGEFRRASNEFKFQIEEELRQVDILDKPSTRHSIAEPAASATAAEAMQPPVLAEFAGDPAQNLPVGQHPNIETLDTSELNGTGEHFDESGMESGFDSGLEAGSSELRSAAMEPGIPVIAPAEGTLPRTAPPFAGVEPVAEASPVPVETAPENAPLNVSSNLSTTAPSPVAAAAAEHISAPAEAEISHG